MKRDTIFYRTIQPSDNAQLADLVRTSLKAYGLDIPGTAYFDPHLDDLYQYYIEKPDKRNYFVAADDQGRVIGGIGVDDFEPVDGCAELQKLYVAEGCKRQGIGQHLIEMIEAEALRLGYTKMYLETHSNLVEALQIYKKNGYHLMDRPSFSIHDTMDRFLLKDLTSPVR